VYVGWSVLTILPIYPGKNTLKSGDLLTFFRLQFTFFGRKNEAPPGFFPQNPGPRNSKTRIRHR
jgi:hypothetical protein